MRFGGQSEVAEVKSILIKHPRDAFISQENLEARWEEFNFTGCPDFEESLREYERFECLIKSYIPEVHYLPRELQTGLDSLYVHDPVIITDMGAILCNMGKVQRKHESAAAGDFLAGLGIPLLGSICGDGRLEGGDLVWLDERTLAVGRGYRTNDEGIEQLRRLTAGLVKELVIVPLPHWKGKEDVMHLMSLLSPVDYDLALVYSRLLPVTFREWLVERGMKLLEVPDSEFETMGCNVLAVTPRKCIMLEGNPEIKRMLEKAGVEVQTYKGEEISLKGQGGPTCLTRPLLRI